MMENHKIIKAQVVRPQMDPVDIEVALGGDDQYSQFLTVIAAGLQSELTYGIKIPEQLKRGPGGRLKPKRELRQILEGIARDNRIFLEAVRRPDDDTTVIIHSDENGRPVAVSLPERRKFGP